MTVPVRLARGSMPWRATCRPAAEVLEPVREAGLIY
jgi:hypothetical protein